MIFVVAEKILLGVTSNLATRSCPYMFFYKTPVSAKQLQPFKKSFMLGIRPSSARLIFTYILAVLLSKILLLLINVSLKHCIIWWLFICNYIILVMDGTIKISYLGWVSDLCFSYAWIKLFTHLYASFSISVWCNEIIRCTPWHFRLSNFVVYVVFVKHV